ncbi:hypothetical protein T492DRAFT_834701 [Pavlovales sp. CCMP2436]|nr:hypothetical protein T492DRAFT_834701 [Pavlovales sp. CCMP2436]
MLSNDTRLMLKRWAEVQRERKRIAGSSPARPQSVPSWPPARRLRLVEQHGLAERAQLRSALREAADTPRARVRAARRLPHHPHFSTPMSSVDADLRAYTTQAHALWRSDLVSNSRCAWTSRLSAHEDVSVHVGRLSEVPIQAIPAQQAIDPSHLRAHTTQQNHTRELTSFGTRRLRIGRAEDPANTRVEFSLRLDCKKLRSVPVGVRDDVFRALGEVSHGTHAERLSRTINFDDSAHAAPEALAASAALAPGSRGTEGSAGMLTLVHIPLQLGRGCWRRFTSLCSLSKLEQ